MFADFVSSEFFSINLPFNPETMRNTNIIQSVRSLFISGEKLTAIQINRVVGTNDARKVISTLRREGMTIKDVRMESGCKLYWFVSDDLQTSIQFEGGDEQC